MVDSAKSVGDYNYDKFLGEGSFGKVIYNININIRYTRVATKQPGKQQLSNVWIWLNYPIHTC